MRELTPDFAVSPQIQAEDVAVIAARGFRTIICNRPDGEDAGQPPAEAVRSIAAAHGLDWINIPVFGHVGITPQNVADMRNALKTAKGPILAYCRSGTRSANLFMAANS